MLDIIPGELLTRISVLYFICKACENTHLHIIKWFLLHKYIDKKLSLNALKMLYLYGHIEILKFLHSRGISIQPIESHIKLSIEHKHNDVLKWLRNEGYNIKRFTNNNDIQSAIEKENTKTMILIAS